MTDPLQQAIERSRGASDWCTTEENVFREAVAIADAALERIVRSRRLGETDPVAIARSHWALAQWALAEMRKLFEEDHHD